LVPALGDKKPTERRILQVIVGTAPVINSILSNSVPVYLSIYVCPHIFAAANDSSGRAQPAPGAA